MDRRRFLLTSLAGALATPLAGEAQQTRQAYRIGLLAAGSSATPGGELWGALLQGLRELGYSEGRNIVVERRISDGPDERLAAAAAELVALRVDVIVAAATQPVHAAAAATNTIPIVMPNHSDPVGSGLVVSLARPGKNVTGLSILNPELSGKRLALLREAVPGLRRVAVLWNPSHQVHPSMLKESAAAAGALGLQLRTIEARGQADYEPAFFTMTKDGVGATVVLGDVIFWSDRARIAELATRFRLPTVFAQSEHVHAGGLMSYGADLRDNFVRAASYVDRILRGAKPADLPVEQPTKFELIVNLKTAKALGLTIPPSLLARADQVIE